MLSAKYPIRKRALIKHSLNYPNPFLLQVLRRLYFHTIGMAVNPHDAQYVGTRSPVLKSLISIQTRSRLLYRSGFQDQSQRYRIHRDISHLLSSLPGYGSGPQYALWFWHVNPSAVYPDPVTNQAIGIQTRAVNADIDATAWSVRVNWSVKSHVRYSESVVPCCTDFGHGFNHQGWMVTGCCLT